MKENYLLTAEVRDRALALRRRGLSDLIRVSDAAPGIFPAAGGVSAAFSDGADGRPLRVLKAKVTADQAGTGDPSAGNIRPISGRTGAVIRRCSLYDPAEVTMGVKLNLATGEVEEAEGWWTTGFIPTRADELCFLPECGGNVHACEYDRNRVWTRNLHAFLQIGSNGQVDPHILCSDVDGYVRFSGKAPYTPRGIEPFSVLMPDIYDAKEIIAAPLWTRAFEYSSYGLMQEVANFFVFPPDELPEVGNYGIVASFSPNYDPERDGELTWENAAVKKTRPDRDASLGGGPFGAGRPIRYYSLFKINLSPGQTFYFRAYRTVEADGVSTAYYGPMRSVTVGDRFGPYRPDEFGAGPVDVSEMRIEFPPEAGTVWGGEVDAVNGILRVTHGQIASYAGEELPGAWISDRDVYAEGTSPSIGAQVVYELAHPVEYPLDLPGDLLTTRKGENRIYADCGDVEVVYAADTKLYIDAAVADMAESVIAAVSGEQGA